MKTKIRHLLAFLIEVSGGTIASKTKIQKEIFFLSRILDQDFGFNAHFYGPYSPKVDEALDEMIGVGFLSVKEEVYGIDSQRGFEMKRYDYSLTEAGKKFADELKKDYKDDYSKVINFVGKLKENGDPDYLKLSIAAKVFYIVAPGEKEKSIKIKMTTEEIRREADKFDWKISPSNVDGAIDILRNLGFAN